MRTNIRWQTPYTGRDYTFSRPKNADGSLTKAAMILVTVKSFSGMFTRKQLLRMIGVSNYNSAGEFSNLWNSARHANLIECGKNGTVVSGSKLNDWYDTYFS